MNAVVAVTRPVVHLPLTSASPWPGEADYRPPGWRSTLSPLEAVVRLAKIAEQTDGFAAPSVALVKEAARLEEHVKLLRQCWVTRPEVWRLAEYLIGPPEVDPFWNPWSWIHKLWAMVRLLDGRDGRDGFDLSLWGRVTEADVERGRTAYVNGPHCDAASYVALAASAASQGHRVAAVVALDGCSWFAGAGLASHAETATVVPRDVLSCDVLAIPEGKRMSFLPAPGIAPSSPTKGYALALWGVRPEVIGQLWGVDATSTAVRVELDGARWVLVRGCGDAAQARYVRTLTRTASADPA